MQSTGYKRRAAALRRFIAAARRPYRIGVCSLALCLLFCAIALRAAEIITPESIELAALGALISSTETVNVNPVSGISSDEEPTCNNLYESEIFVLDGKEEEQSEEAAQGDDATVAVVSLKSSDASA